jgi:CheY-like chemotaxis protein
LIPAGDSGLSDECEALQVAEVMTKPVKPNELAKAIQAISAGPAESDLAGKHSLPCVERSLLVLIADDSPVNREVAMGLIEMCGHRAKSVENGREAVEAVKAGNFDLVFMDVEMPVMDGFAATEAIRRLPGDRSETLIYAMTAHALAETEQNCRSAGMDGVITKPIAAEQLMALLNQIAAPAPVG